MQELILKNEVSQSKIEALIQFLKSWGIEAEIKSKSKVISKKKNPSDFFGTISKEEGEKMQEYLKNTRIEWERSI
jgi:hypothetical protein